ncbi:MAG: hypothetical protein J6C78_03405 [Muribaculaceae bacterium]|nr:hypothetical protein [Muribaculaceae bacterium]
MNHSIHTETFKTPPSVYFRYVMGQWCSRYWWTIAIPLSICGVLSIVDIRWILVALMVLFLGIPFVMANVYFYNLLTPSAQRAVMPKRLTITPRSAITITYYDCTDDEDPVVTKTETIEWAEIKSIKAFTSYFVIKFNDTAGSIMIIPYNVLKVNWQDVDKLDFFD